MRKTYALGMLAVLALFFPSMCRASQGITPTFTYNTAVTSATTAIVSVTTAATTLGAVAVDSPTLIGRISVEVDNIDSSANLWCVLGSTTPTVNGGRKIAAGSSWVVGILSPIWSQNYSTSTGLTAYSYTPNIWCLSDGSSATKAAVSQAY